MALADLGASTNLMPLYVWKKLSLPDLTPTHMTLELATRSFAYLAGIAKDVFMQVGKFTFPANFIIVDYDVDPRVPLILGRPFLRMARTLVDVHGEELILRDGDEQLIFLAESTSKYPHKHCGKEDNNFDYEADLREIEFLLNQDPSTESNIEIIDPILEKFTKEPAIDYSPPPGDDDDDLFDLKSDNDEWKKFLYAHIVESNDLLPQLLDNDSTLPEESSEIASLSSFSFENKDKVFNPRILILGRIQILKDESKDKDLRDKDLILEERNFLSISSDKKLMFFLELTVIKTLLSFSSENEDKPFNPGILISNGGHLSF
nr:reverse transcriptase domain-containing protein [Tanacetum cinerariifolium]